MRILNKLRRTQCNTAASRLCTNKGARRLLASAYLLLGLLGGAAWSQHGYFPDLPREGSAAVHLDETTGYAYIVDGGRRGSGITSVSLFGEPVLDALRRRGIETLVFICSHPHADHLHGLLELVEEAALTGFTKLFFVDSGYSERAEYKRSLRQVYAERRAREPQIPDGEEIDVTGRRGNVLFGEGDVAVETFQEAPRFGGGSEHDQAIVTTIRYRGEGGLENRVVDTDDASDSLVRRWTEWALEDSEARRPDTLVVPHHGARTTDIGPLLQDELVPDSVVIPVNQGNRYDHPNALTLVRLKEALGGLENVHITAVDGPVEVRAQGVTSAQDPTRRKAYFADLAKRQRLTLVPQMIAREQRLLSAKGDAKRALARAQTRDGETLRAVDDLARQFAPLPPNTGTVIQKLREARERVGSLNSTRSSGGRRAVFEHSKVGKPLFGGVIMGADATLRSGQRPVAAEIVVVQGLPELRVSLSGTEARVVFSGVTQTELAVALDFVSGRHAGTHPDDVGLVGLERSDVDHWHFALHPAVANTAIGGNLMRLDMLPSMLPAEAFEAADATGAVVLHYLPCLRNPQECSHQWHDREAVLDLVDGRLRVFARNEPRERLLTLRYVPENPRLGVRISEYLRARSWTFRHIERFARAVLVLHWLSDHGIHPTGEDGLTVIRWPVEPELHRSELSEEIDHLLSKEVN